MPLRQLLLPCILLCTPPTSFQTIDLTGAVAERGGGVDAEVAAGDGGV